MKVAMLQILVVPSDLHGNITRALCAIKTAADNGADCAVLPECFDLGWADQQALRLADTDKVLDVLKQAAKENKIHIVAGLTEKVTDVFYNTAVFISSIGTVIGKHRKINLVPGVEDQCYMRGNSVTAFDTPIGRIGLTICADNTLKSIFLAKSLHTMGAQLILSPSSWAVPADELGLPYGDTWYQSYQYLNTNFGMSIIGVSNVGNVVHGPWSGWFCIGNSIAVTGKGQCHTLAYGKDAACIDYVEV